MNTLYVEETVDGSDTPILQAYLKMLDARGNEQRLPVMTEYFIGDEQDVALTASFLKTAQAIAANNGLEFISSVDPDDYS